MDRFRGKPTADAYIKHIALALRYINEERLSQFDITQQQAYLLGAIRRLVFEGESISRKRLQDLMKLTGPSVTSLLNGLEKKGFIVRHTDAMDGRAMRLTITERGEQTMSDLSQVLFEGEKALLKGFTEEEAELFTKLLEKAYKNLPNHYEAFRE